MHPTSASAPVATKKLVELIAGRRRHRRRHLLAVAVDIAAGDEGAPRLGELAFLGDQAGPGVGAHVLIGGQGVRGEGGDVERLADHRDGAAEIARLGRGEAIAVEAAGIVGRRGGQVPGATSRRGGEALERRADRRGVLQVEDAVQVAQAILDDPVLVEQLGVGLLHRRVADGVGIAPGVDGHRHRRRLMGEARRQDRADRCRGRELRGPASIGLFGRQEGVAVARADGVAAAGAKVTKPPRLAVPLVGTVPLRSSP